jgi:hypothetical protein
MRAALSHGKQSASAVLEQRRKTLAADAGRSGLLIAEGDSWFDGVNEPLDSLASPFPDRGGGDDERSQA